MNNLYELLIRYVIKICKSTSRFDNIEDMRMNGRRTISQENMKQIREYIRNNLKDNFISCLLYTRSSGWLGMRVENYKKNIVKSNIYQINIVIFDID
jgi:hypothetical protein